ncbi:Adenylate cyclase, class 3 [Polaromonas sp. OV174]|uniref:FHA domain-containing protein n=1 Tax=Polaromonas sp. OV174 TaxID=1855300 RepID=UPI0008EAC64F|nr:FHA domain-containing protein [Polaromonas sp. OV174]SFC24559.1 Adenylate cyclase, class 3 [Polaromonas sp. OV174]
MAEVTVVFADLTGSTGVFESLGNAKATQAITRLTQWIGRVCEAHCGQVIKYLGDGVLIIFPHNPDAVEAATELQRVHQERIRNWPEALKMRLQVGMARGEIVEHDGDCYGDAVNVASRLSDLSGPEQILATDLVIQQLPGDSLVRFRCLGAIELRGRSESCVVHRIEWQSEVMSELFTLPATLTQSPFAKTAARPSSIELSSLDVSAAFTTMELPVFLGRDPAAQFVLQDPRVSRNHARIEWRAGKFYLEDVSSYGTWVRFSDSSAIIALRRQECVLLQEGEIALGAPFEDFTVPTVSFKFHTVPLAWSNS